MALGTVALFNVLVTHAMESGLFERVNSHEPKNAPGRGLTCSVTAGPITPYPGGSGLASTTARVAFMVRIASSMLQEPQDDIDPVLMDAADVMFTAYSGDFDMTSNARCIDLLGESGEPMRAEFGYFEQDGKYFRFCTIMVPVIVNDSWAQVA